MESKWSKQTPNEEGLYWFYGRTGRNISGIDTYYLLEVYFSSGVKILRLLDDYYADESFMQGIYTKVVVPDIDINLLKECKNEIKKK